MPKQVTYGVSGLIDWNAIIPVGKASLNVHFSGGALTKYGITPAEFTTTDPTTQRLIEDSHYYRSGKIRTLRTVGKPDIKPLSRRAGVEVQAAYQAAVLPITEESSVPEEPQAIEVACIEDAIEYMHDHYGISALNIRTPETLQRAASQHGIKFILPRT